MIMAALAMCVFAGESTAYDPTEAYGKMDIEGWTVYVNHRLPETGQSLCDRTLALLRVKLYDIVRVIPEPALSKIRAIPIWVELDDPKVTCMCYHPSREWLSENGLNPEKAGSIEIGNPNTFYAWTLDQPTMVLHELAHGYHHQVLTYECKSLKDAYEAAVAGGRYDSVLRFSGAMERHYALNNDTEYFAEGTEAFFGVNDYYPFVRAELNEHDPKLYDLMFDLWQLKR